MCISSRPEVRKNKSERSASFPGRCASAPFDRMKQIDGQIGLFDVKPVNEKNECLGEPCAHCDVEWCSVKCFIRRGYIRDMLYGFTKDSEGKPLRRNIESRVCKETRFD
jgi:hypothetical protein